MKNQIERASRGAPDAAREPSRRFVWGCVMGHSFIEVCSPDPPEGMKCRECDATAVPLIDLDETPAQSDKSTHTSGPWEAKEWTCHAPTTVMAGNIVVAECSGHGRSSEESVADARLIAQAWKIPDLLAGHVVLLEACKGLLEELRLIRMKDTNAVYDPTIRVLAEAAIQQAERT